MPYSNLDNLICFNFYSGWRTVTSIYKEIYGNDITPQNIFALELCEREKKITMGELSKGLNIYNSAISTLVSRMEKNGLLIRTHGNEDRRTVFIQLTEKGDALRKQVREKFDQLNHAMTGNLTQTEIQKLQQIVTTLSNKNNKKQVTAMLS